MKKVTSDDKKLLNNTNRKLSNIMKKAEKAHMDINLPKRSMDSFKTRKEFNSYIKKANKIINAPEYKFKTNKYGFTYSEADKQALKEMESKRNKVRQKQWNAIKNIPVQTGGITVKMTLEQMSKIARDSKFEKFNPRQRNIENMKSFAEYQKYMNILNKESSPSFYSEQNERYKENYIKSLNTVWGNSDEIQRVIQNIKNMSTDDFIKYYYSDDYVSPDFIYMEFINDDKKYHAVIQRFG